MDFFRHMDGQQAIEIEQLSRLAYELREHRRAMLEQLSVAHETELLQRMESAAAPEHPTYEQYLAARILEETRQAARALIADRLRPGASK